MNTLQVLSMLTMSRLITMPYETRDPWEMTAIALDGSVYLELWDPSEEKAKR